jgi:hypothetical protein
MNCRLFLRFSLIVLVFGITAGCAQTLLEIPPPSDMARAEFGTMGVLPVRLERDRGKLSELGTEIARTKGQGAIEDIKKWALEPVSEICGSLYLLITAREDAMLACLGSVVYGIAAAPIAGIVGAVRTRPASEVEAAARSLLAGFNRINPGEALRDQIVLAGGSKTGFTILAIDEEPKDPAPSGRTDFDSIMTLFVELLLRFDDDKISPAVTLDIKVMASVVHAKDATPFHAQIWRYRSEEENFFELADDGAKRLEAVLAKAYERLARKIVHDVFVASAPETQSSNQPGTVWAVDTSSFYDVASPAPPEGQDAR